MLCKLCMQIYVLFFGDQVSASQFLVETTKKTCRVYNIQLAGVLPSTSLHQTKQCGSSVHYMALWWWINPLHSALELRQDVVWWTCENGLGLLLILVIYFPWHYFWMYLHLTVWCCILGHWIVVIIDSRKFECHSLNASWDRTGLYTSAFLYVARALVILK